MVEQASESELSEAAALGDTTGMFNCPHTGVALAVLVKLLHRGVIKRDQTIVIVSTAHGLKFSEFKQDYHEGKIDFSGKYQNRFIRVSDDVNKIRSILETKIHHKN